MKLEPLMRLRVRLGRRYPIGPTPKGRRSVWTHEGGEVEGPGIRGEVAPVGGEFELIDGEGVYHVDVRLVIRTHDGANIFVQYFGVSALSEAVREKYSRGEAAAFGENYFVTQPRFETSHPDYRHLNTTMAIAEGRVLPDGVEYLVYRAVATTPAAGEVADRFRDRRGALNDDVQDGGGA